MGARAKSRFGNHGLATRRDGARSYPIHKFVGGGASAPAQRSVNEQTAVSVSRGATEAAPDATLRVLAELLPGMLAKELAECLPAIFSELLKSYAATALMPELSRKEASRVMGVAPTTMDGWQGETLVEGRHFVRVNNTVKYHPHFRERLYEDKKKAAPQSPEQPALHPPDNQLALREVESRKQCQQKHPRVCPINPNFEGSRNDEEWQSGQ